MAKRSNFQRRASDKYLTPFAATVPLAPFLTPGHRFIEPCAGDGRLVRHIESHGLTCVGAFDTEPDSLLVRRGDALRDPLPECDVVVTNPPWRRDLLHQMIDRFMRHAPTWLLFDADWPHTSQRGEVQRLLRHCSHMVSVGRVRWIEGSKMSGKDNCMFYRFDINHTEGPRFYAREV